MIFGSVCSGIEAASVAWNPLGWKAAWFAEIEKFPCAVLDHHYPDVPNLGDMTKIEKRPEYGRSIDLLVGGTPCQSFSIAGLRKGLDDQRGNLALEFCRILARKRPRWFVWENVPGVLSSNKGRDFAAIISRFRECGYGFAWRILDAQYFGVPQRRRRVFVVGHLGDWRIAAAVLFERESLRGDSPPRRETGQSVAGTFISRSTSGGWSNSADHAAAGMMIPVSMATGQGGAKISTDGISPSLTCNHEAPILAIPINAQVALRHNKLGEGTGFGIGNAGDPAFTLQAGHDHAVAFQQNQLGEIFTNNIVGTLNTNSNTSGRNTAMVNSGVQVRRLTPRECERLMGFPDDFTRIPVGKKMAADGPRYKVLGNSMAVPVVSWIGKRIQMMEDIKNERR